MRDYKNLLGIAAAASLMFAAPDAFAQQTKAPQVTTAPSQNNLTFDTTPDDHARLKEIFGNDHSAQKVRHASFSLAPGSVVPGSIHLVPLPPTVVNIQPTWQGNDYFRVGHKVVIVDPQSKKVEGVLTL
ncbi:DUF1236 domain-containing protein [Bradyrhizobium sp.]|jgi:hypothetical protein|uniref:DUF1236 domain-containing protein n=1 Tax=Bradyrhizobium sp. TaxID=376 RepID=UPI003C16C8D9